MNQQDKDRLRELAEQAKWTGRWYDAGCNTVICSYGKDDPAEHDEVAHPVPLGITEYLAAVNPAAILSLLEENERLAKENELLRQHAAEQISDSTLLTGIDTSNGAMNVGLEGGAAQLLAESFFDQFQQSGAINYLELRFESESKMPGRSMVVTLQLVGGTTPGQRIADQAREISALKEQVAVMQHKGD